MGKTKPYEIPKKTVLEAYHLVRRNKGTAGIDGKSLEEYDLRWKDNLYKLWNRMSSGSYFPKSVKRDDVNNYNQIHYYSKMSGQPDPC